MKLNFLYHGGAVAASGYVTLPLPETMPIQASVALPMTGGSGSVVAERFSHRNYFSFERAESHVVGSFSERDKAYGTLATTTIEGLNILNVVTCDKIVARVTSKHPADRSEPSFIPIGSRFENLRIAGHKIDVELATDLFTEHHTWSRLSDAHKSKKEVRDDIARITTNKIAELPAAGGMISCTLARNLDNLPGGLTRNGHGIYVPHFGTVYLAEYIASSNMHRLLMLHVDLGCSIEGCFSGGSGETNGGWPPQN